MPTVSVRLPEDEQAQLDETVDLLGQDRSTTMRAALREGLAAMCTRESVARYQSGDASVAEAARRGRERRRVDRRRRRTQLHAPVDRGGPDRRRRRRGGAVTRVYPAPTSLTALGSVGELDLLAYFDGELVVPAAVEREVTTEPARTDLASLLDEREVTRTVPDEGVERATEVLGVEADTHEAAVLGGVLGADSDDPGTRGDAVAVAIVSEDRRLRRLAEGLGGSVTSAFGVVVRAAIEDRYFSRAQAKRVVRRTDDRGLGMTGTMRERVVGDLAE